MGLEIAIGFGEDDDEESVAWTEAQLSLINRLLARHSLPLHTEGTDDVEGASRAAITGFGYSCLHTLRRAAAKRRLDPKWIAAPLARGDDAKRDPALETAGAQNDFHLLVHSDCEGYYVPVDFEAVLFDEDEKVRLLDVVKAFIRPRPATERLAGDMLGSSVRLLRELVEVAPALGVRLEDDRLSDEEADRINALIEEGHPLERELMVWLALFEAARLSVAHKKTIVFT